MSEPSLQITYHGGDADKNAIDMRLLGLSLQGADKITSDGLLFLIHGRLAKRGERAPVILKAREPVMGSVDIQSIYEAAKALLPLGAPIASDILSTFLEHWWNAIKAKFTGRSDVAELAINRMAEVCQQISRDHLSARDASEKRSHEREMSLHDLLRQAISAQQRPMEQFASPVGPSVGHAEVRHGERPPVRIDTDDAEAIREAGRVTWTRLADLQLKTDGFRIHTSGLSIENPEGDGFLMARVRDPLFGEPENPYTTAANWQSDIIVLARRGYKDGELVRVDIVEFKSEIPTYY